MKFNEEFVVGKHGIGFISQYFINVYKDTEFVPAPMPTYQKLTRSMNDAQIERKLKPGICTLGDMLAFLDNAPEECKDGYWNLFYSPSCVARFYWGPGSSEWDVRAWERDDYGWFQGYWVLSPATDPKSLGINLPDSLPLELYY